LTSNSSSINLLNKLISLRYPLKNEMIYWIWSTKIIKKSN
jgi:hypothetical protein